VSDYTGTIFINMTVDNEKDASKLLFEIEEHINSMLRHYSASASLADTFQDDETGDELDYDYDVF